MFCRLDLEESVPDQLTCSKSDVFRHVFEGVLRRRMSEGLVGGEGFAIDASVIKADANRARGVPRRCGIAEQCCQPRRARVPGGAR